MPYGPHTADDRERMLGALGLTSVDQLFEDIPIALRASRLDLPEPEPELELAARLSALAARNRTDLASFLGAGVYRHWSPPAVDQLLLRGEWYTAYTPYQPEISQGTLQSIYEYESLLAELVDLDVVSASHYDGAAATAEAALMTCRATRRERVLVSRGVHPALPRDAADLLRGRPRARRDPARGRRRGGRHDGPRRPRADAGGRPTARSPASSPRSPTSSACSSRCRRSASWPMPRARCSSRSIEPVSPGRARAARRVRRGHRRRRGPAARASRRSTAARTSGILASTDALVRQIPGRLVGMTTDLDGQRAFVMTMRAREQDIRRDKAASNICTNQALLALAASIYLATIGPHGLRDVAALGAARAAELEAALAAVGVPRIHPGPYLNEFAVRVPDAAAVHRAAARPRVSWPASSSPTPSPTIRAWRTRCSCAPRRSPRRDEIARFAEALASPGRTPADRRRGGRRSDRAAWPGAAR